MKRAPHTLWTGLLAGLVAGLVATPALAVEIVTREDLVNNVVKTEQLVKVADNGIFLLDSSSSADEEYADTGLPAIHVVKNQLEARNDYFPDLGHNIGIYTYTDWQDNYPVQRYDRAKVAAALAGVREKGAGPTPLRFALEKLEGIVKPLQGRTAVFVFWDGEYTGKSPVEIAKKLASQYDLCFYIISSADGEREAELQRDVSKLNACSRVIPLATFIDHPEYTSGALFDVKVTENVQTTTEGKISVKVNDINFAFDETELRAEDKAELDELGMFLMEKPEAYAVIAGYTDNVGSRDHNEGLSKGRAIMVADYLTATHGIDDARLVLFWYGPNNPKVANDTKENRAINRRVEVNVGLAE